MDICRTGLGMTNSTTYDRDTRGCNMSVQQLSVYVIYLRG